MIKLHGVGLVVGVLVGGVLYMVAARPQVGETRAQPREKPDTVAAGPQADETRAPRDEEFMVGLEPPGPTPGATLTFDEVKAVLSAASAHRESRTKLIEELIEVASQPVPFAGRGPNLQIRAIGHLQMLHADEACEFLAENIKIGPLSGGLHHRADPCVGALIDRDDRGVKAVMAKVCEGASEAEVKLCAMVVLGVDGEALGRYRLQLAIIAADGEAADRLRDLLAVFDTAVEKEKEDIFFPPRPHRGDPWDTGVRPLGDTAKETEEVPDTAR